MRKCLLAVVTSALIAAGCDEKPAPALPAPATPSAASQPTTTPVTDLASASLKTLPLTVIPLTASVPETWAVGGGVGGRIVLHGSVESGEIEVLLSTRPSLSADDFKAFVAEQQRPASQPSNAKVQVLTRDGLTIVETVDKPIPGLVTYNVKYLVAGPSLDYQVYELNIGDLTQEMFDKDGDFIRKVLLGLRYDASATEAPR